MKRFSKVNLAAGKDKEKESLIQPGQVFYAEGTLKTYLHDGSKFLEISTPLQVLTTEITLTPLQVQSIGFGQTLLPPPPAGKAYVILSAEGHLHWPGIFGEAYDFGFMSIQTDGGSVFWFNFSDFLDQTTETAHSAVPEFGSNILSTVNGGIKLFGLNSNNGNSPVTISLTYKLINI